jgi:hypothetical protein
MSVNNRAQTKNVLSSQILKPVLAGAIAAGLDKITSNQNKSMIQLAFFAGIVATGTIIGTNIVEFAPIPVFIPSIDGLSGKAIEVKASEIVATFGSAYALDYVSSGYNFNQYDLILKFGIVGIADIASESIVEYILQHNNLTNNNINGIINFDIPTLIKILIMVLLYT